LDAADRGCLNLDQHSASFISRRLLRRYIGMGVRLVIGGGDLGFMQAAATARASQLRGCL
jgi:2-keto-3-deoxy-L-rhamnonate aldolase RhmA